jgi:hypothetical protein
MHFSIVLKMIVAVVIVAVTGWGIAGSAHAQASCNPAVERCS